MESLQILNTQQFDLKWLKRLFAKTEEVKRKFADREGRKELRASLRGGVVFRVFAEPSTRTWFSFGAAASHLGMTKDSSENAAEFSSLIKGESPEHMIRVLCGYRPDVIVWRHKQNGIVDRVAPIASQHGVSVINAGEGTDQHPTQSFTDVFTIDEYLGRVDDILVAIGGDLRYGRTVKSLAYLLAKNYKGVRFRLISPPELSMDAGVLTYLSKYRVPFEEISIGSGAELRSALSDVDVAYCTRTQNERIEDTKLKAHIAAESPKYRITLEQARSLKPGAILLHPMPIKDEIERSVDLLPCAKYFEQSDNKMFVAMALFQEIVTPSI